MMRTRPFVMHASARSGLALLGGLVLAGLAGGCGADGERCEGEYQRPYALARITRDELEPIRHPVEASSGYVSRAADRLSARPSNYDAIAEQSTESFEQLGHWWDAVLGRPERRGYCTDER